MSIGEELETAIDAYPGHETLCGAIRISRDQQPLLERAFGYASVQLDVINQPSTRFHIASMTKMFIAAAAVRLALDGTVSLGAHPSAYMPALSALDRRITLHHLLSHTSGLADIYGNPNLRLDMVGLAMRGGSLLDYLVALPQEFSPGTKWSYSTTGFLLLAYLLEQVTGTPFDRLIGEMFLVPLEMRDTGPDDPSRANPGRALGQIAKDGAWFNAPNDRLAEIDGPREFYSTVADLDRWGIALLDGKVLNDAARALTFSPHARVGPGSEFDPSLSYGYGWFLGDRFRFIGGMTGGFRSAMWQYPDERLNVIMLWNNERIDSQRLFRKLRPILLA
ncbi:serine hydrolase domain-containing protein [Candidatus Binatus sp.]|uniref:serine hydrolase domain-containing protein n=1 Tax=Candidatus Binatus sp. TaxID=2811406 RepID=UPI003C440360